MPDGRILTEASFRELQRQVRQLQQQLANTKRLATSAIRRHEAAWPAPSNAPYCTYFLDDVEGWDSSGSSANLRSGNLVGWFGASSVQGDEDTVGLEFLPSESSPSTNGNWQCNTTGHYEITVNGQFSISVLSGTVHECSMFMDPYHKIPSTAIRIYQNSDGSRPLRVRSSAAFDNGWTGGSADYSISYSATAMFFLEEGERLTWRGQLVLEGSSDVEVKYFAYRPNMLVRRYATADQDITSL